MKKHILLISLSAALSSAHANAIEQSTTLPNADSYQSLNTPALQQFLQAYPEVGIQSIQSADDYQRSKGAINDQLNTLAKQSYSWTCSPDPSITKLAPGVNQYTYQCSGTWPDQLRKPLKQLNIDNLTVHIVKADISTNQQWSVKPLITGTLKPSGTHPKICTPNDSDPSCQKKLVDYANQYNTTPTNATIRAAINGSYYFIPPASGPIFFDTNCLWKSVAGIPMDFDKPTSTFFLSDGLTIIDSEKYANNCATFGPNSPDRATFVVRNGSIMTIEDLASGIKPPTTDITQALGAGPMMIQDGEAAMEWQAISSTFEYAANTAVALATNNHGTQSLILFTVDGKHKDDTPRNGMFSFEMANFLLTALPSLSELNLASVDSAMSMDQGGSTTMVTCPESDSSNTCQQISSASSGGTTGGRSIFNGLAIMAPAPAGVQ